MAFMKCLESFSGDGDGDRTHLLRRVFIVANNNNNDNSNVFNFTLCIYLV